MKYLLRVIISGCLLIISCDSEVEKNVPSPNAEKWWFCLAPVQETDGLLWSLAKIFERTYKSGHSYFHMLIDPIEWNFYLDFLPEGVINWEWSEDADLNLVDSMDLKYRMLGNDTLIVGYVYPHNQGRKLLGYGDYALGVLQCQAFKRINEADFWEGFHYFFSIGKLPSENYSFRINSDFLFTRNEPDQASGYDFRGYLRLDQIDDSWEKEEFRWNTVKDPVFHANITPDSVYVTMNYRHLSYDHQTVIANYYLEGKGANNIVENSTRYMTPYISIMFKVYKLGENEQRIDLGQWECFISKIIFDNEEPFK